MPFVQNRQGLTFFFFFRATQFMKFGTLMRKKILKIIVFFFLLIRKRGQIWWRCHANSITTCYLMYSRCININFHRFICLHFSRLSIGPIRSRGRFKCSLRPMKGKALDFFSLLLRVVRLKSDKYQPEHLTSVSHFKRTTVEATFGLRVD